MRTNLFNGELGHGLLGWVCAILPSVFARAVGVAAVQRTDFNGLLLHILGLCAHSSSAREPGGLYPERIPYHVRRLDLSCSIPPSAHSLFLSLFSSSSILALSTPNGVCPPSSFSRAAGLSLFMSAMLIVWCSTGPSRRFLLKHTQCQPSSIQARTSRDEGEGEFDVDGGERRLLLLLLMPAPFP